MKRELTEKQRAALELGQRKGKKYTPEQIAKRVASRKKNGKKQTEEWKKAHSEKMRGRKQSPEVVAKRTAAIKARKDSLTPEERERKREEVSAKVSASKRANPHMYTEEQRRRMSEGQKRYLASISTDEWLAKNANWLKSAKEANHKMPTIDTKLEQFVGRFFDQAGIEYEHPFTVGSMEADFYLPTINTIVEVQGCYWHACEQCGFSGNEFFEQQNLKDKRRFGFFAERGYKIRTIWEHDIKKNVNDNLLRLVAKVQDATPEQEKE